MADVLARRTLYPSGSARERADLFQSLFALVLVHPGSRRFWIDSPWLTNFVALDNRYGQFRGVFPNEGSRHVRMVDYLAALRDRGIDVRVITKPPQGMTDVAVFHDQLRDSVGADSLRYSEPLHAKGIVTELFVSSGSMNFTHSGIKINEESVTISTERQEIARRAHDFQARWDELGLPST